MNKHSAFSSQQTFFDSAFTETNQALAACGDRELFYRLIGKEIEPSATSLGKHRLRATLNNLDEQPELPTIFSGNTDHIEEEIIEYANTGEPLQIGGHIDVRETVRQYAPLGLTDACWLQGVGNAAINHTHSAARLFALYSRCRGFAIGQRGHARLYRRVLRDLDIELPEIPACAFCEDSRLLDSAFVAPLIRICLAQFPGTFMPEILGYTLAHVFAESKILRNLHHCAMESEQAGCNSLAVYLNEIRRTELRSAAIEATKFFLEQLAAAQKPSAWLRLSHGFHLYSAAESRLVEELERMVKPANPVSDELIRLLKNMASVARGHHRNIRIGGKKLDDWFASEPLDAETFLEALFDSEYFDQKNPANSRFFKQSTAFAGPMFGIFDARQLRLFRECLSNVPSDKNGSQPPDRRDQSIRQPTVPMRGKNTSRGASRQKIPSVRNLYFELLNIESHPEVLPAARQYVSKHLRKSRAALHTIRPVRLRHFDFTPADFESCIKNIHEREIDQYHPFVAPPKIHKEVYVWGIEQFAPTILVDGCWLQNISRGESASDSITPRLFRIFADELGAGRSDWNHPNVYRKLLASLDIQLPEFTSSEFTRWPGFLDAAFDIPVLLLAISQFPCSFLPEIIGLNLAIELSGLGSTYMKLIDELKYWDIDPTIVSLHLSIDNLATGHAAIACEVVKLYLDQILNTHGHKEMQEHWKRIWTGYLSLRIVPKRFRNALALSYFRKFIVSRAYRQACNKLPTFDH